MTFLKILKYMFCPLKKQHIDFGEIKFIFISNNPDNSYWEGEWTYPATNKKIFISIPGNEFGPYQEAIVFYKEELLEFNKLITLIRPKLSAIFKEWLNKDLPDDIFSELKISGIDLNKINSTATEWEISFETKGDKWLSINIPFKGETPLTPTIDT